MYGYALCHACIELRLGMGVGDGSRGLWAHFRSDPPWASNQDQSRMIPGVKGHAGVSQGQSVVKLLKNAL